MLKLCGFNVSNYYNKVKLALLEKGIPFEEELVYPTGDKALLKRSPMGKVPFLEVEEGAICESQAILEYLEDRYPTPPLYPSNAFQAAKCRELLHFIELYLELPARRLHSAAFYGGTASDTLQEEVRVQLEEGVKAFAQLARFEPYLAGGEFSHADCAAFAHLPVVSLVTKIIYGNDFLATVKGIAPYLKLLNERPHIWTINKDRKAGMEDFLYFQKKV